MLTSIIGNSPWSLAESRREAFLFRDALSNPVRALLIPIKSESEIFESTPRERLVSVLQAIARAVAGTVRRLSVLRCLALGGALLRGWAQPAGSLLWVMSSVTTDNRQKREACAPPALAIGTNSPIFIEAFSQGFTLSIENDLLYT